MQNRQISGRFVRCSNVLGVEVAEPGLNRPSDLSCARAFSAGLLVVEMDEEVCALDGVDRVLDPSLADRTAFVVDDERKGRLRRVFPSSPPGGRVVVRVAYNPWEETMPPGTTQARGDAHGRVRGPSHADLVVVRMSPRCEARPGH